MSEKTINDLVHENYRLEQELSWARKENRRLRKALEWAYTEAQWVPEPSDACLAACRKALEKDNGTD